MHIQKKSGKALSHTDRRSLLRKLKTILSIFVFGLLLFVAFFLCVRLLERKDSLEKNGDYFEVASQVDVLLLGSSHMINGINPAVLYEEYGIASYNLGGHGNVMAVTYWELVNALDYATPSYVVIDTYLLEKDYHYLDVMTESNSDDDREAAVDQLHEVLDAFPLTKNKWLTIEDLISDSSTRSEFVFDFIRYHSRWSSLEEEDFAGIFELPTGDTILGSQMRWEVDPDVEIYDRIDPSQMNEEESISKEYLCRIIELCLDRGIYPILVQIPFAESTQLQEIANSAQLIADAYGIPYINMNYVADIIDSRTDQQSQTHLNALGAWKVSLYLGEILSDTVGVPDRRGQEGYEAWDEAVLEYHDQLLSTLLSPTDLYAELMALQFDEVSAILFINNDSVAFYDISLMQLISKLSGTEGIYTMAGTGLGYCLILDPASQTTEETMAGVPLVDIQTSFGRVNFTSLENYDLLSVGEDTDFNQLDYVNNGAIDVQILLYDSQTGEQIGHLYFDDAGLVQQ